MALDSALLFRPTESLIRTAKRRFFPFDIPNHHHQLRHYISTADPDRIYVVSDRTVFAIHISTCKVETIALVPLGPRCLDAGYGWIGLGGADNGECAFIRLGDYATRAHGATSGLRHADVDSALSVDLDAATTASSPWVMDEASSSSPHAGRRMLPEVQLHKFGGTIVNSVTIHRFPGDDKGFADEDVVVLSNNDKTVTLYSLTRSKVLKVITHPACMNYAIISPDSTILAAVGDENRAYFYGVTRNLESSVLTEQGEKLTGWNLDLLRFMKMDIGSQPDDKCCFTIAFSPSSHLCAIGSQSGIITVFDVAKIRDQSKESRDSDPVVSIFRSSRFGFDVGAVRCMGFSPEPWDLLVWVEDHGRAGVADIRQAFLRRQILKLDLTDPDLQKVSLESVRNSPGHFEIRNFGEQSYEGDMVHRTILDAIVDLSEDQVGESAERSSLRESLIQNLTERELIVEFLNTARWPSRAEDILTGRPTRANVQTRPRPPGSTEGSSREPRPPLPPNHGAIHDFLEHMNTFENPLSRTSDPDAGGSGITNNDLSSNRQHEPSTRTRAAIDPVIPPVTALEALSRQRLQRSTSIPRRSELSDSTPEGRYDRSFNSALRANVAAERLRRQRQLANEVHNRTSPWEQRYRQPVMGFEQPRSSRWRSFANESPTFGLRDRDHEPAGTAGIGWGADGRTLYIGTVDGIFEFQINIHDRKTFPDFSYR